MISLRNKKWFSNYPQNPTTSIILDKGKKIEGCWFFYHACVMQKVRHGCWSFFSVMLHCQARHSALQNSRCT